MKKRVAKQFLFTVTPIFILQALMFAILFGSYYSFTAEKIKELGVSNMRSQTTMAEDCLNKGRNVLWIAAMTVDHMMNDGAGSDEILRYLVTGSDNTTRHFDPDFTGIYGLIGGKYLDGAGWTPPEGYDPKTRTWYTEALEAKGEVVLSAPYVDAQTGGIIISFSRMLSDGESVLSLDIVLNEIQSITEEMTMGGMGYGFIVDSSGLVVSHLDKSQAGQDYSSDPAHNELLRSVVSSEGSVFEMTVDGQRSTLFSQRISDDWYVVIVANNELLFSKLKFHLLLGIVISVSIYLIIVVFCMVAVKRISRAEEGERESNERMKRMNLNIIRALISTIDAKDRYTDGHSQRVADYAVKLASRMGKSEEEQKIIYFAGLLHDVGKIRVPEAIINKPGKLTPAEFDQIRIHPVSGFHILHDIHYDERIGYGAKYHHERYDGTGYPNGLEGKNIPEVARIIAVADAYDAMASERSYRGVLPQSVVRSEILSGKGTQFDPDIADIMLGIIDEDTAYEYRQKEAGVNNVLVIDDEKIILRDVRRILGDMERIRVYEAMTKQETFDILRDIHIDLILLDLKMPDTDGFTLYAMIREKYSTPVILMTGDKSIETVSHIKELGMDDYLTKPLNVAITREAVHGVLHRLSLDLKE